MGDDGEAPTWWELRLDAPVTGTADRLWEELGAAAVSAAAGGLVASFAGREAAAAAQSALGAGSLAPAPEEGEWRELWRAWARPTVAGRVLVLPAWLAAEGGGGRGGGGAAGGADGAGAVGEAGATDGLDRAVVVLEPGAAWGHGGHPTTALVLAVLSDRVAGGESVLDVGCGSGALGLAALALGAATVTALDIDPVAVEVTRANAVRNGVADRLTASTAPVTSIRRRFDVTVANIGARVLVDLAEPLASCLLSGGFLVLSGLLDRQVSAVVERFAAFAHLHLVEVRHADGWAAPVFDTW